MEKQVKNHLLAVVLIDMYFKACLAFLAFPNAESSLTDSVIWQLMLPFKCKKERSVGARCGISDLKPWL